MLSVSSQKRFQQLKNPRADTPVRALYILPDIRPLQTRPIFTTQVDDDYPNPAISRFWLLTLL